MFGIAPREPPDQRLLVGRDEHLRKRRDLRGLCQQHGQRAAHVGIEVLERFVDPEESQAGRRPQHEHAQEELRDHLLAVAEVLVVELFGTDAPAQGSVALETDARPVDEELAPVLREQVLERLDALVEQPRARGFERRRRRFERGRPFERIGHRRQLDPG